MLWGGGGSFFALFPVAKYFACEENIEQKKRGIWRKQNTNPFPNKKEEENERIWSAFPRHFT